jgi:hypothetical protein
MENYRDQVRLGEVGGRRRDPRRAPRNAQMRTEVFGGILIATAIAVIAAPARATSLPNGLVCGLSYVGGSDSYTFKFNGGAVGIHMFFDYTGQPVNTTPLGSAPSVSINSTSTHDEFNGVCQGVPTLSSCGEHLLISKPGPVIVGSPASPPKAWWCMSKSLSQ